MPSAPAADPPRTCPYAEGVGVETARAGEGGAQNGGEARPRKETPRLEGEERAVEGGVQAQIPEQGSVGAHGGSGAAEAHGSTAPKGVRLGRLNAELYHATTIVECNVADQEVDDRVELGRGGSVVLGRAQKAKEGRQDYGTEHDGAPRRELPAEVCVQEKQRGDRHRPARRADEASALGALEAAQDIIERAHVLDPVAEAKAGDEVSQAGQANLKSGHGKAKAPKRNEQLQRVLPQGEWVRDTHLSTKG